MADTDPVLAPSKKLPPTPVQHLTRLLAWRMGVIVFLASVVGDQISDSVLQGHPFLGTLVGAMLVCAVCLPLVLSMVLQPALRIVQEQAGVMAESTFRSILQSVREAVSLIDVSGKILFANRAAERLGGFEPGTLAGRKIQSLVPPGLAEVQDGDIAAFLAGSPTIYLNQGPREISGKRANGDPLPLEVSWNSLPTAGAPGSVQFVAVLRDITARKRQETMLRESEALFRTLADTAPVMIWMADATGTLNFLNRGWLEFRGRTLQQEINQGWMEGLHPEDHSRCLDTYAQAVRDQQPYEMEYRMRRCDGEFRWLLDRGVPRRNADGTLEGFVGICVDVTVRKQAEEALRASERHFRELLEGLPVAVRIVQDERVVFANLADALLHGYSKPEEEIGLAAASQVAPQDVARVREYGRRRLAGEPAPRRYEAWRRRCDGSELLAESEAGRTRFDGRPANLIVIRDLTDRKRVELYEKLLPVCCVCGKIRNDDGVQQGAGGWQRLDQYLTLHSNAEFSHTFCPECLVGYRRKNLLPT